VVVAANTDFPYILYNFRIHFSPWKILPRIWVHILSCLYALKGVGILLVSPFGHSQLEVSVGQQSISRIIHLLFPICGIQYNSSCHAIMLPFCVLHLLTFPLGWTTLWRSHFIFRSAYIDMSNMLTSPPFIFSPRKLYHPGIGDLNLPVLHLLDLTLG
jgi:hypothetical protein